ncbi:MAG: AI-2E family transporter [Theionarchaea archaeon]|nr:AI-2E family transporter [Theionarchaea archaeon]
MDSRFFTGASIVVFSSLLLLGLYITYYFLDVLLIAIVLSYLIRPAKDKIHIKNESISTLIAAIVVFIPLFSFLALTFFTVVDTFSAQQALRELFDRLQTIEDILLSMIQTVLQKLGISETQIAEESLSLMTERLHEFTQTMTKTVVAGAFRLPYWLIRLFLAGFLSFYFVRDGKEIKSALIRIVPEESKVRFTRVINACDAVIYGIVIGYLFKAVISGFIAVLVFYVLGIGNPILMGAVIAVFDFIPIIGPWTVCVALFLWYALQGEITYAIEVAVICYCTISLIPELYIRPKISGMLSHVHPAVMLVGILGGIMSMGPIGILAGPLILGTIVVIIKTYFFDMEIEKDDIVDRLIQSIKRRIHALRHGSENTRTSPEPDTEMAVNTEKKSEMRESIKTTDKGTSLDSSSEGSEDSR